MNRQTAIITTCLISSVALPLIVFAAIGADALLPLIGGMIVVGLISIALTWIGVNLFSRYTEAVIKRDGLRYDHAQVMAKYGVLFDGLGYDTLPALPEPEGDIPIDMHGVTNSLVAPYRNDALEVLALSKQVMTSKPDQIVPYARAKANDYFSGKEGYEHWQNGCQWLITHQWVAPRKQGDRNLGTFCTSGTVSQLYDRLRQQ